MARKPEFDKDEKLLDAMTLFWQKGYANTAISDLVETLKINRFSLYNAYGDKQNLYYKALETYLERISFPSVQVLTSANSGWPELKHFLHTFVQRQRSSHCGCFLQNALVEHAGQDDNVLSQGHRLFDFLLARFSDCLGYAQSQGQIPDSVPAEQLATLLLCQMQGIRVLGKAKRLDDIDTALTTLFLCIEGSNTNAKH